jgi:hypothetical protein
MALFSFLLFDPPSSSSVDAGVGGYNCLIEFIRATLVDLSRLTVLVLAPSSRRHRPTLNLLNPSSPQSRAYRTTSRSFISFKHDSTLLTLTSDLLFIISSFQHRREHLRLPKNSFGILTSLTRRAPREEWSPLLFISVECFMTDVTCARSIRILMLRERDNN